MILHKYHRGVCDASELTLLPLSLSLQASTMAIPQVAQPIYQEVPPGS